MSVIVYCEDSVCFHKILCDTESDVIKIGWAKTETGFSCLNHTWEATQ
jgi:hypothetical protein